MTIFPGGLQRHIEEARKESPHDYPQDADAPAPTSEYLQGLDGDEEQD